MALDPLEHGELERDDDHGVGGEGEAEGARSNLTHLAREGGEATLHLAVADEGREEGEAGEPEHCRGAQERAVGTGRVGVVVGRRDGAALAAQGAEQEGERDHHADRVEDEDCGEGPRPVHVDEEATDHAAEPDAEVDEREVDAEELLPGRTRHDGGDEGVPRRPVGAPADAHDADAHDEDGHGGAQTEDEGRDDAAQRGRDEDVPAAETIGQGAPRPGDDECCHRDQSHEHASGVEADVPDLGEVDDGEGQDHAPTQVLEGHGREQPSTSR